ncbi:polyphosphate polymerase domain-containing protein [Vallitalea pronyensis]|uniref:Polyphosphate polymerase domain-containing protein n=1 Tax=Vallitalea pronyensis TaxID=1348613 RepID=A0A8J8MI19_9FIRM|nr:polyphosphate polymerase domain-containing protein [Vallitalea pronyensis]QUI21678.1 polyphosphate polymerase domain-containing protein [Vallitalea pronyensis]
MLNKRHELKYTVSPLDYKILSERMKKVLQRDRHCPEEGYQITSLYYDDPVNTAYVQKVNGEAIRHKYRIRYYGNDYGFIRLEKKSKIHQMTMKESVPLTKEEVERILANDYAFLVQKEQSLYQAFYLALSHGLCKPKVIVRYTRKAYTHPVGDLRITFDRDIRTSNMDTHLFNEQAFFVPAIEDQQVIVEIKFNHVIPDFIQGLIQMGHVPQTAASKYVMARKYNYQF